MRVKNFHIYFLIDVIKNQMFKSKSIYHSRILLLQKFMFERAIDAYIIPSSDPHLSEYLPAYWQVREWFTGFTGSVGLLIVTLNASVLFVDSRYWKQAEYELNGTGVELVKILPGEQLQHLAWIIEYFSKIDKIKKVVGVPAYMISLANFLSYKYRLAEAGVILADDVDLIDKVWTERPVVPCNLIMEHRVVFAITDRETKLQKIAREIKKNDSHYHLIASLDDIAWILNLRGSDVPYNPVFLSYLLISREADAHLFVQINKLPVELAALLTSQRIFLHEYEDIGNFLLKLPDGIRLWVDSRRINLAILKNLKSFEQMLVFFEGVPFLPYATNLLKFAVVDKPNPSLFLKALKISGEIVHIRETMRKDGVALAEFCASLELMLASNDVISEITLEKSLERFRASQTDYIGPSFASIIAFKENAALPHYRATTRRFSFIKKNGLLLIDSGGQYLGGTTDITRMIAIGKISDEEKRDCTLVLKGLIALTSVKFPVGIKAPMLDAIARAPIWASCIDYGHGTGHGVGYFLNVHEGTHSISCQSESKDQLQFHPGMITSIEPGIYRPGKWGVRIENLAVVQFYESSDFGDFLKFETLTLAPIDRRCLLLDMLNPSEIIWLNKYHKKVAEILRPELSKDAQKWLDMVTSPL